MDNAPIRIERPKTRETGGELRGARRGEKRSLHVRIMAKPRSRLRNARIFEDAGS